MFFSYLPFTEKATHARQHHATRQGFGQNLIDRLIADEQADRQACHLELVSQAARFPYHRDLIHFDWLETPLEHFQIE
jgi:hypothetical protein